MSLERHIRWIKPFVFLLCLAPLGRLGWKAWNHALGANPIQVITFSTGTWTLVFLCVTLSVTPLRRILRQPWLIRFRRMFGLLAFFHACLHFTTYLWLDKFFDLHEIVKDVYKRPFITAGFTAFVALVPLASTSTAGMIRRMGGRRWQMLHRLIYLSACAGVVHYYWLVKSDIRLPVTYGSIVALLLGYRLLNFLLKRPGRAPAAEREPRASEVV